jgi:hypothetical protein
MRSPDSTSSRDIRSISSPTLCLPFVQEQSLAIHILVLETMPVFKDKGKKAAGLLCLLSYLCRANLGSWPPGDVPLLTECDIVISSRKVAPDLRRCVSELGIIGPLRPALIELRRGQRADGRNDQDSAQSERLDLRTERR